MSDITVATYIIIIQSMVLLGMDTFPHTWALPKIVSKHFSFHEKSLPMHIFEITTTVTVQFWLLTELQAWGKVGIRIKPAV